MSLSDDQVRTMLARRAGRGRPDGLVEAAHRIAVDSLRTPHRWGRPARTLGPRLVIAALIPALAVAVLIMVAVTAVGPRTPLSPSPAGSSPTASPVGPSPTASPVGPARVRPLTVAELGALLAGDRDRLVGRYLVVAGTLVPAAEAGVPCADPRRGCAAIGELGPPLPVAPVGDIGPGPWAEAGEPLEGTFAVVLRGDDNLEFRGIVEPASATLAWTVAELLERSLSSSPTLYAVHGWLVGTPPLRCPAAPTPLLPDLDYGCGQMAWLTGEPYQPASADGTSGSVVPPPDGMRVQNGAYERFAPDPASTGWAREPRRAVYLVARLPVAPCGPTMDCFVGPEDEHWQLVGRVDPGGIAEREP